MNYMAPLPIVINTIQLKMVTMIIIDVQKAQCFFCWVSL